MSAGNCLEVRVNGELVLDAGICEETPGTLGTDRVVHPPRTTLFHQVLAYLRAKPDPPSPCSGSLLGREGAAAAALTLRWGSYLAVLFDRKKPVWPEVNSPTTSRISDDEMARINIEASAALAEWVDLCRADWSGSYRQLVNRALFYLPITTKTARVECGGPFAALAMPEMAAQLIQAFGAERLARIRSDLRRFPSRVFANALINTAWRNGPIERIHAGHFRGYPLDQRRMTPIEEWELMTFSSRRLALGMDVCHRFETERPRRRWTEQVLPYALAKMLLITPSGWTLTESSREIRFPARMKIEAREPD